MKLAETVIIVGYFGFDFGVEFSSRTIPGADTYLWACLVVDKQKYYAQNLKKCSLVLSIFKIWSIMISIWRAIGSKINIFPNLTKNPSKMTGIMNKNFMEFYDTVSNTFEQPPYSPDLGTCDFFY